MKKQPSSACGRAVALVVALTLPASAQTYTVTDLGTLSSDPAHAVRAVAINDRGHVHGTNELNGGFGTPKVHSFLWDGTGLLHIYPLKPSLALGGGLNDRDQVVGQMTAGAGKIHGYLWEAGQTTDIHAGLLDFSQATGINRAGYVCGTNSMLVPGQLVAPFRAYLRDPAGSWVDLGTLGGVRAFAAGLNDRSEVVGTSTNAQELTRGFVTLGGGLMVDLGELNGNFVSPRAINDSGLVVGSTVDAAGGLRPVSWSAGSVAALPLLGGPEGAGHGLNERGDLVGMSRDALGAERAVLWRAGSAVDLTAQLVGNPGWTLTSAADINDLGEICGTGLLNGQTRAFRLNPVLSQPVLSGFQPALAGADAALFGLGFQSGATVFVVFGLAPGSTPVPGCPGLGVGLAAPSVLAAASIDGDGRFELPLVLPPAISGLTLTIQAVDPVACEASGPVRQLFQ